MLLKKKNKYKNNKFSKKELIKTNKNLRKRIIFINEKNLINGCANITGGGLDR